MSENFGEIGKGIKLENRSTDPSSPENGQVWYNAGFNFYEEGMTKTLSSGGSSFSWSEVTGTTQTIAVSTGYIANNAALVTFTLPSTAAIGDTFKIAYKGVGGWKIAQNSGQQIIIGSMITASGVLGSIESASSGACVEIVCITANTLFEVLNLNGIVIASNTNSAYFAGGFTSGSVTTTQITKLAFVSDTASTLSNSLGTATQYAGAVYSSLKGYICGGRTTGSGSSSIDTIQTLTFSGETTSNLGATVLSTTRDSSANAVSSAKGYLINGLKTTSSTATNDIQALTFSGETVAIISATVGVTDFARAGNQSTAKGYAMSADTATLRVDTLTFSGETTASLGNILNSTANYTDGFSSTDSVYVAGGGAFSTAYQRIDFATETYHAVTDTLDEGKDYISCAESASAGYSAGGENSGGTRQTDIEKLAFDTETNQTLAAVLATAKRSASGVQS